MIYTKEKFVEAIDSIEKANNFITAVNKAGHSSNFNDGSYVDFWPPICDYELCDSLEAMFDDKRNTIHWFCEDIDFGRKYESGSNVLSDGTEFPIRNAGDLYEYLVTVKGDD